MVKVVSVRFREAGKAYHFLPGEHRLSIGDAVMVNTSLGLDMAFVVEEPFDLPDSQVRDDIQTVMRPANEQEKARFATKREREKEAFDQCLVFIERRQLKMSLVDSSYTFDGKKLVFFFTAENRVDFRELVKDLTSCFHTRIELRQIGTREQARMVGGIGVCGRELCCCTFLEEFVPVSVRMAKEQGLSLNPTKLSGACGRLMCCLQYEQAAYEDANSRLPKVGKRVSTPEGNGTVIHVDVLREKLSVRLERDDEAEVMVFDAEEVKLFGGNGAFPSNCAKNASGCKDCHSRNGAKKSNATDEDNENVSIKEVDEAQEYAPNAASSYSTGRIEADYVEEEIASNPLNTISTTEESEEDGDVTFIDEIDEKE